jgi:hypothetical protein
MSTVSDCHGVGNFNHLSFINDEQLDLGENRSLISSSTGICRSLPINLDVCIYAHASNPAVLILHTVMVVMTTVW